MIEHSTDITKLAGALVQAQGEMRGAEKDSKNPAFKSQYASLESVISAARPALQKAGIFFTQAPGALIDGQAIEVTTMLIHGASGQWMRSTLHVLLGKRDPQGIGSAITYGCRYSLMATLGLPPVDDDGEAAMERDRHHEPIARPVSQPKPKAEVPKSESVEALEEMKAMIDACETVEEMTVMWKSEGWQEQLHKLGPATKPQLNAYAGARKTALNQKQDGEFLQKGAA